MTRNVSLLAVSLVILAALATSPGGCSNSQIRGCEEYYDQCDRASHCTDFPAWLNERCDRSEGRWACIDRECFSICPGQCQSAEECADKAWLDEVGCPSYEGTWTCQDTFCVGICPGECEMAVDCQGKRWPYYFECLEDQRYWACQGSVCVANCAAECRAPQDCEGKLWPANVDCPEGKRRWSCQEEACVALCDAECSQDSDCNANEWTEDCVGYFHCTLGECVQVCDEVSCGDGACDAEGGETLASCPDDCDPFCEALIDCLAREWTAQCDGRWDCLAQECVEVCDYDSCGDGACSIPQGETEKTCPRDCQEGCRLPTDCYLEQWGDICQGRWNCFQRMCMESCPAGDTNCGDEVCWGLNGENEDSCFRDCLGGPCETLIDCFAHRWYEDFGGHWQCNPADPPIQLSTGACEAVRDDVGCGDGACDVLGGETPIACVADCNDYSCTTSEDCNALSLPGGCTSWICSGQVCAPRCE